MGTSFETPLSEPLIAVAGVVMLDTTAEGAEVLV